MLKRIIIGSIILMLMIPGASLAASFLEEEAGISAYTNVATVDLDLAATAYKNIEQKTATYIIGSVELVDYDETYDVHVYIDTTGGMIAYYRNTEPATKIIDWRHYSGGHLSLSGSNLEDALSTICYAMSVSIGAVNYYDYRVPNAKLIKIISDEGSSSPETFRINIPGDYTIHKALWSLYGNDTGSYGVNSNLKIDGVQLGSLIFDGGWRIANGEINSSLLTPDMYHEISVYKDRHTTYAAIVLFYSEPE